MPPPRCVRSRITDGGPSGRFAATFCAEAASGATASRVAAIICLVFILTLPSGLRWNGGHVAARYGQHSAVTSPEQAGKSGRVGTAMQVDPLQIAAVREKLGPAPRTR